MAKCVEDKTGRPMRVSNDEAAAIVAKGGRYITKNDFKRAMNGQGAGK